MERKLRRAFWKRREGKGPFSEKRKGRFHKLFGSVDQIYHGSKLRGKAHLYRYIFSINYFVKAEEQLLKPIGEKRGVERVFRGQLCVKEEGQEARCEVEFLLHLCRESACTSIVVKAAEGGHDEAPPPPPSKEKKKESCTAQVTRKRIVSPLQLGASGGG